MLANVITIVENFFQAYGVLAVLAAVLAVGILRLLARIIGAQRHSRLTKTFRERFHAYAKSSGEDNASYERLAFLAGRLGKAMGDIGALSGKPPFTSRTAKNFETVLQVIPELRMHFADVRGGGFGIGDDGASWVYHSVDDALIQFLGALDETTKKATKNLFNPIAWFREGIERILALPFYVMSWAGIIKPEDAEAAERHIYFRTVAGLAAILAVVTIVSVLTIGEARTVAVYRDAYTGAGNVTGNAMRATFSAFSDVAQAITASDPPPQPRLPNRQ